MVPRTDANRIDEYIEGVEDTDFEGFEEWKNLLGEQKLLELLSVVLYDYLTYCKVVNLDE